MRFRLNRLHDINAGGVDEYFALLVLLFAVHIGLDDSAEVFQHLPNADEHGSNKQEWEDVAGE